MWARRCMLLASLTLAACNGSENGEGGLSTTSAAPTTTRLATTTTIESLPAYGSDYVMRFNQIVLLALQAAGDQDYNELALEQAGPNVYGSDVAEGIGVYIVADEPSDPVEALLVRVQGQRGRVTTPTRLLASAGAHLFPDLTVATEQIGRFNEDALPALDNVSDGDRVRLGRLDLHVIVADASTVVFAYTAPGMGPPQAAHNLN